MRARRAACTALLSGLAARAAEEPQPTSVDGLTSGRRLLASTGCQSCCANGTCQQAWKSRDPGLCCSAPGADVAMIYCCPYENGCASDFRCPTTSRFRDELAGEDSGLSHVSAGVVPVVLCLCCCMGVAMCAVAAGSKKGAGHHGGYPGGGYPVGGYPGGGYYGGGYGGGGGGGYGAGAVAGAGGLGLLGGYMLGQNMGGGGFFGGGDYYGDGGGGGGGFMAADGGGGFMAADGGGFGDSGGGGGGDFGGGGGGD